MCSPLITKTINSVHYKESKHAGIHQSCIVKSSDGSYGFLHQTFVLYGIHSWMYTVRICMVHLEKRIKWCIKKKEYKIVRNGIRTHAHIRGPDLESGALDRSATLTTP